MNLRVKRILHLFGGTTILGIDNSAVKYAPKLSVEEKNLLVELCYRPNGDSPEDIFLAKQILFASEMRLVASIARCWSGIGEFEELLSEGGIALQRAMDAYIPDDGEFDDFVSVVVERRIRGSAYRWRRWETTRNTNVALLALEKAELLSDNLDPQELAEELNISLEKLTELYEIRDRCAQVETFEESGSNDPFGELDVEFLLGRICVEEALPSLSPLERRVVELRVGFPKEAPKSARETHRVLAEEGYTGSWKHLASYTLIRALRHLREIANPEDPDLPTEVIKQALPQDYDYQNSRRVKQTFQSPS